MVQPVFSDETYKLYDKAVSAPISIETAPNSAFEDFRKRAILKIAEEMGIRPKGRPWARA